MIINGGSRSNGRFFAQHLTNGEENESVTICEIRSLAAESVADAFREMEAIALGTQCTNYFYHATINPLTTEALTPAQWSRAVDALEANLGLTGHARLVVEHRKKARTHRHFVWLRINVSTMRAVKMTDDYERHQATARALEREYGLARGKSVLGPQKAKGARPARRPKPWETFRGHKSGIDPRAMKQRVTEIYRASASGEEFEELLAESGYRLTKGDRAGFCIVDQAGELHSLARRIEGVNAESLRTFLNDIEPARPHE